MLGWSRIQFPAVKLALAVVVLASFGSALARADSFTFTNSGGVSKETGGSYTLSNSAIGLLNSQSVAGYTLGFSTSTSFTGSLETGGSWAAGGSLTIKDSGVIVFEGTFSGPVTWTLESAAGCTSCEYQLSGPLTGTYYANGLGNGPGVAILTGSTSQLDLTTTKTGYYKGGNGTLLDKGGTTNLVTPVPEPQTLGMMGAGFLGMAFALKRKLKVA